MSISNNVTYQHASYKRLHLSRNVGSFLFFSKAFVALAIAIGIFTFYGVKIKDLHVDAVARLNANQQNTPTIPVVPAFVPVGLQTNVNTSLGADLPQKLVARGVFRRIGGQKDVLSGSYKR